MMGSMARSDAGRPNNRSIGLAAVVVAVVYLAASMLSRGDETTPTDSVAPFAPTSAAPTSPAPSPSPSPSQSTSRTDPMRQRPDAVGRLNVDPPTAIRSGTVDRSSLAVTATYDAVVDLAVQTGDLVVAVTIDLRNDDAEPIDRLDLNTIAPRLGAMVLGRVTVDAIEVAAQVDDQTIFVPLGGLLPPGERARLRVSYRATIAATSAGHGWFFTRGGGVTNLYRWLPWISVAHPFDHPNFGNPWVTPVSPSVRVRLRTDRPVVVAATGSRVAGDDRDGTYVAEQVRDFALTIAEDYRLTSRQIAGIEVDVFTRPGGLRAETLMAHAEAALVGMIERVGPYPYERFTIAETARGFGMEAPGLIWIPEDTAAGNLRFLVAHETAHQWFYGLVGSDQAREPFADEAPTDFLARDVLGLIRAPRCGPAPLDRSVYEYGDACYYEVIYIRGGLLLDELRDEMGNGPFWAAMRAYVDAHRFGFGSTRALLDGLDAATPLDFRPRFEALLPSLY